MTGVGTKLLGLLGGLLVICVVLLMLLPPLRDIPACTALLARSESDVIIPLPANCVARPTVATDDMVKYLEQERTARGLIFKEWITCTKVGQYRAADLPFVNDPHWLPSYVPGTYQYRRAVIIGPYARPTPQGSAVVFGVCLMPWRRYFFQITGECNGKYSVWK